MAPAPPQTQPPSPQPQRGSQLHPHPTQMAQRPGHPAGAPPVPPHTVIAEPPPPVEEPPPEHTYPCGCGWPGTHKQDCMWSLWEQMRDNYLKTKDLMGKFMTSANTMQEATREGVKCQCPAGCHGTDLGKAMGLQQMTGVTLPWDMTHGGLMGMGMGTGTGTGVMGGAAPPSYSVQNEARKLMEEQKRIKNTWVQFLSIFDMALDMANDVSKDRWEQNRRRKERQRLEREQRLEEMRKERLERQKGSKPEPPPERAAGKDDKVTVEDKNKDKLENQQDDKPEAPAESPKEEENAPPAQDEKPAEDEPAPEEQPAAEEAEEG